MLMPSSGTTGFSLIQAVHFKGVTGIGQADTLILLQSLLVI